MTKGKHLTLHDRECIWRLVSGGCPECGYPLDDGPCQFCEVVSECARYRAALEAIVGRDPDRPGPKAAVVVNTQTLVQIAKQALSRCQHET